MSRAERRAAGGRVGRFAPKAMLKFILKDPGSLFLSADSVNVCFYTCFNGV